MASNYSRIASADSSFEEARRERLAEMIDDQDSSCGDLDVEDNYLAMCRDEEIILYSSRSI